MYFKRSPHKVYFCFFQLMYQTPLCSPVRVYQTTSLGTLDSDRTNTELGKDGSKSNLHINKYMYFSEKVQPH